MSRIAAVYRLRCEAGAVEARARALAVEQSVELPLAAIDDERVLADIVATVENIEDRGGGVYAVTIGLATATTGFEAGQLLNMLFGNSSLHEDVVLEDAEFPAELTAAFPGPCIGLVGLKRRAGADGRALTCSALKPQGLAPEALARLAADLARGGLDYIKDDHGLADQGYSPFAARAAACAAAVRQANAATGGQSRYVPSLSGDLDRLRQQVRLAQGEGLGEVLAAPLVLGLPAFQALRRDFPQMAFLAHPAMAGAARLAPPFLLGKLFRLLGADGVIFPNHGGRFGYSADTCRRIAETARGPLRGLAAAMPIAAGGMSLDRVPEMLDFYGEDVMLLIGGGLLGAGARLVEETRRFVSRVHRS